jgi:YggT family protein
MKVNEPSYPLLFSISSASLLLAPSIASAEDIVNTAVIARPIIDIFINTLSVFFLCRIIISWYPKTDLKKFPYAAILWPTEPLLAPVRDLVPPAFGVDVSPIVWIMLLSFLREILTGQQGILTLIEKS